ncbi:hypothetical protein PLESTB_000280100 [Pleodorina starrii]|uniref:Uncharacterized protein n=1 Tax=Pleodorina starrii TaxID=330485 RepID=A0A9W6EZ40_9CHLO|nr:hypothetical protein PLESTB_000280100 [Pleodorina starrii]
MVARSPPADHRVRFTTRTRQLPRQRGTASHIPTGQPRTGPWVYGAGPWVYGAGPWVSGAGPRVYGAGPWVYGAGPWIYGAGPWVYGAGPWVYGAGPWVYGAGPWIYGAGLWDYGAGPLVCGAGPWVYGAGPWVYGAGLWDYGAGPLVCGAGPWVYGARPWVYGAGPLVCGAGPWVYGAGLWVYGAGLWDYGSGPLVCGAGPWVYGARPWQEVKEATPELYISRLRQALDEMNLKPDATIPYNRKLLLAKRVWELSRNAGEDATFITTTWISNKLEHLCKLPATPKAAAAAAPAARPAASTSQASGSHNVRGAAGVTACAGHKRSRDNHGPEGREPRRTAEGYAGRADDAAAAEARGEATAGPRGAAYDNAPPPPPPPPPAGLVERPSSGAGGVSSGGGAAAGAGAVGGQDAGSAIAPANAAEKLRGCGMDDQQMKALAIRIALPEETFLQELRTKVVDPLDADVKAAEDAADKAAKVAKEAAEVLAEAVAKYKQWEETASTALRAEHPDILLAVQGAASMVKPMANSYQEKAYAEGANIMAQTTQFSADAAFKMSQLAARQRNEEWGRVEQFACLRRNALGTQRLTAWSDIALGLVGQMSKEECWAAARAVGEAPRMGSQELERLCIFQERLRQKEDPLCRSLANELLTYIGLEMVVELGKGRRG